MRFTRLKLKNWRNFVDVDLELGERLFVTGPNACGKSNLLDAFRFLRDIAKVGGGLQFATEERGGIGKMRCLAARKLPGIALEVELRDGRGTDAPVWTYGIGLKQEARGKRRHILTHERVSRDGTVLLDRPDAEDERDPLRLTETHLEHVGTNQDFRPIAETLRKIHYLHLVPQLLRFPELVHRDAQPEDPYGIRFLDRILETPERQRTSRLNRIEGALRIAVPELSELHVVRDHRGSPHLEAVYKHWRPNAGRQREDQFSDGTLRLIALLWTLLDGDGLLLLEEPEISLHSSIVAKLPSLIWRLQRAKRRQVFISSHSVDLFSDSGIAAEEVALLRPSGTDGAEVRLASQRDEIRTLLEAGMNAADAALPTTHPNDLAQLTLFD